MFFEDSFWKVLHPPNEDQESILIIMQAVNDQDPNSEYWLGHPRHCQCPCSAIYISTFHPQDPLGTDHVDTTSEAKIDPTLHRHDIAHGQNKFNSIGKTEVMWGMIQNEVNCWLYRFL